MQTPLRYPGNLEIDAAGSRLFISDSSNHRILVTSWDGQFQVPTLADRLADRSPLTACPSHKHFVFVTNNVSSVPRTP